MKKKTLNPNKQTTEKVLNPIKHPIRRKAMFGLKSLRIAFAFAFCAFAVTVQVTSATASEVCIWEGRAPACNGKCKPGYTLIKTSKRGGGKKCWTGKKAYCCKTSELIVRGAAPFCNGKCKAGEEMLGKTDRGTNGKKCLSGKAAICRIPMDKK